MTPEMAASFGGAEPTARGRRYSAMQSFKFYIDDDRYALPILLPVQLPDGVPVRERARAVLGDSSHYRGVEVFVAATSLFKITNHRTETGSQEPCS